MNRFWYKRNVYKIFKDKFHENSMVKQNLKDHWLTFNKVATNYSPFMQTTNISKHFWLNLKSFCRKWSQDWKCVSFTVTITVSSNCYIGLSKITVTNCYQNFHQGPFNLYWSELSGKGHFETITKCTTYSDIYIIMKADRFAV